MKLKEIIKSRKINLVVLIVLLLAFFVRTYRLDQLLGFYYDQGRDALVIWDLIHNGKLFLIGPTTGIEGIFRGPWYYWLITPFYYIGQGNPVYPSIFLSLTTVIALYFLYLLSYDLGGKWAAALSIIVGGFSNTLVSSSRWLSNPTPMYLIGILFVWSLVKIVKGEKYYLGVSAFLAGLAMQFGSATEVFYIPAFLTAVLLGKKKQKFKEIVIAIGLFVIPFIPQIIFDLRHNGVLTNAIYEFIFGKNSFKLTFWQILKVRLPFYYDVLSNKIWSNGGILLGGFLTVAFLSLIANFDKIRNKKETLIVLIILLMPFAGMIFFQGNEGNVFDYYFTGYYLLFVLVFSLSFSYLAKSFFGKVFILVFIALFLVKNVPPMRGYLGSGVDGENTIALGNQLQAVEWVYANTDSGSFNVDVYVPPVISYSYDYLFLWQGTLKCGVNLCGLTKDKNVEKLYTLFEQDPPHPERLEAWLNRQKSIGKVENEIRFGGITVQRRERVLYE